MSDKKCWILILVFALVAYFVTFPDDAQAITTPAATFLGLTSPVSPWFYGVVAVAIMAKAVAYLGTSGRQRLAAALIRLSLFASEWDGL